MPEENFGGLKPHRMIFIDVLRGIAILWMIETHVVDAMLYKTLKTGTFYNLLNISNGFVAVTFLFCAGAGFWLAAQKKANDYRSFKKPLWVYLRRLFFILIMGYWLHIPFFSLSRMMHAAPEQLLRMYECDVLHAIVFSSLIALFLLMIIRNLKVLPYIFGILALFFFLYAPIVWTWDPFSFLPAPIATYIVKRPLSKFPIFPWSGYFFSGAAITAIFYSVKDKRKFAWILSGAGFLTFIIMIILKDSSLTYPGYVDWWHVSPAHSFYRTSISAMAFALLFLVENRYSTTRIASVLRLSGQESLFMYIFHLMIVYGSVVNVGLNRIVGQQLGWPETAIMTFVICLICYMLAKVWNGLKYREHNKANWVMWSLSLTFIVIFILNP